MKPQRPRTQIRIAAKTPTGWRQKLSTVRGVKEALLLAQSVETPSEVLAAMDKAIVAWHESIDNNPNYPNRDSDWYDWHTTLEKVRTAIAQNPNTSPDLLVKLADFDPGAIGANPGLPLLLLEDPDFLFKLIRAIDSISASPFYISAAKQGIFGPKQAVYEYPIAGDEKLPPFITEYEHYLIVSDEPLAGDQSGYATCFSNWEEIADFYEGFDGLSLQAIQEDLPISVQRFSLTTIGAFSREDSDPYFAQAAFLMRELVPDFQEMGEAYMQAAEAYPPYREQDPRWSLHGWSLKRHETSIKALHQVYEQRGVQQRLSTLFGLFARIFEGDAQRRPVFRAFVHAFEKLSTHVPDYNNAIYNLMNYKSHYVAPRAYVIVDALSSGAERLEQMARDVEYNADQLKKDFNPATKGSLGAKLLIIAEKLEIPGADELAAIGK